MSHFSIMEQIFIHMVRGLPPAEKEIALQAAEKRIESLKKEGTAKTLRHYLDIYEACAELKKPGPCPDCIHFSPMNIMLGEKGCPLHGDDKQGDALDNCPDFTEAE